MKQSTSFAQVANNLLNVLQGYTKGIRLLLVMFLTLTVTTNAWGADYKNISFSDIKTGDVIIIVGLKSGNTYAMINTGTPPTPATIDVSNNTITTNLTNITFTATKNSDATVTFVSTSSGTLYCTNANNGVKIGTQTGDNTKFTFDTEVNRLKNIGQTRWLGIYNTQDWRCYTSASAANIAGTATYFYRKVVESSHTITAVSNNETYGTVDLQGTIITATPKTGYRVSTTTPYTISPSGSATVTQNGNTFTVTPSANTTITINFEALPKYTVTLNAGPGTCAAFVTETSAGAGVTLPTPTLDGCGEWSFAGWTISPVEEEITEVPNFITDKPYKPSGNITLHAVYQRTEESAGGGSSEENVVFSAQGYTNQQEVSSYDGSNFSVAFDKGSNNNTPKYYTSGSAIRIYGGGYFTVSSDATITKIVLGFGSSDGSNAITTNVDTYSNGTWTGSANSVKFTIGGSSGNRRIASLTVTTSGGGSTTYYHSTPDCSAADPCDALQAPNVTPTATANSITLSWVAVPSATSYNVYNYTTGDLDETTNLTYTFNGLDPETEYEWGVESAKGECFKETRGTTTTKKACTDAVTIGKGTETNGTFTLSTTGQQSTCDGSVTVTLSNIQPATGYQFSEITQSGINTGVTIDNTAKTVTYAQNATGESTINITFTPIEYTLSLESTLNCVDNGSVTIEYNATSAKNFTAATRDDYTCTGYWSAPSGGVQVLKADGTFVGDVSGFISGGKWVNTTATKLTPRWETEYKMTLSKGEEENGTYILSTFSIETSGCATSTTRQVTITATPDAGYEVDQITYSGAGTATQKSGPTLGAGKTTWVYTFAENNKGTGTFTVTFKSLPKYTISFSTGTGNPTQADIAETTANAGITLPAGPTPACTDWTFAGWWTEEVSSTDTSPGTLMKEGDNYKPTADITLYAVYSYTEAGGGGSGFYLSVTKGAATYYIGEKGSGSFLSAVTDVNSAATFNIENNQYLYYGNKTYVSSTSDNTSLTIATTTPSATWAITDDGETITFKSNGTGGRYLAFNYNNGSPRFSSYGSTYTYELTKHTTSTTTYNSNPTCLMPVWNGATIDKTALTVNCGERSSMDGAAKITFSKDEIFGFSNPITIEASEGFLVSTSRTPNGNYQQSVSQSPLIGTDYPNTFNDKFVYVRAEAPAMSEEDLSGTITIKNSKGETLQTFSVTADVTCTTYTLTLNDRGTKTTAEYYAGASVPKPADPEGVCTDPIHYVFDGWAETTVTNGSTGYTPVSFPYTVTGNTKFYAVYRYVEDGSADSGDYVKLTEDLDDYSGDYLFIYETGNVAFDGGRNNVDDELDATSNTIEVTINDNTIASNATTDAAKFTIVKVDGGYSIKSASGYYIGWGGEKNGLNTNSSYTVNYLNTITDKSTICGKTGYLKFNKTSGQERFRYYQSGQESIALYRKAASYLYTTSPVCGPHLAITEGKDIYVTGGNAQAARDLVMAQQKVSYKATRLNTKDGSAGGTAPDVVVANNGITKNGIVTSEVKVTFENTIKEQQADGTYTITGDIVVTYEAEANNLKEDIQVQLAADYNAEARDNFTVHARSLPSEFVIVAKSGDKWYALNADMSSSKAQPANGQVTLNDLNNPTEATYAPCNAIYAFEAMPQGAEDRISVRFIGQDNKYLWAASGTNTGIQNNSTNPAADALAYNWKLYTEDNITYRFGNANNSRQLTLNGEKFGMYASGVQEFRILPYVKKCIYNYAPSNLKVSVLKGSYVTLTWDAVAGATKYQYSTDANNWTDAGTEPTVTINGLEGANEYTYYIRAYHEDAGVTNECIDYAEITFTTANCDDVPTDISFAAGIYSITLYWQCAAETSTVILYSDEAGTQQAIKPITDAKSPLTIDDLDKVTTYYAKILAGGICASPLTTVSTAPPAVDVVEWTTEGMDVYVNTDDEIIVSLEGEVHEGSGSGNVATELFFSKYFEATGSVKLLALFNGTGKDIDLSTYSIKFSAKGADYTGDNTTEEVKYDNTIELSEDIPDNRLILPAGKELIMISYPTSGTKDAVSITNPDGTTIKIDPKDAAILECAANNSQESGWDDYVRVTSQPLNFSGNDAVALFKGDQLVDIIGAGNTTNVNMSAVVPASTNPSFMDAAGWYNANGYQIQPDGTIGTTNNYPLSTNRCLLIRRNTVINGDNAVLKNTTDFVTLGGQESEWMGYQIPDGNGACEGFEYVGKYDYANYYTTYDKVGKDQTFESGSRNPDGTVPVYISEIGKYSCKNLKITVKDEEQVLVVQEFKVPIIVAKNQNTDGEVFTALKTTLGTVVIDQNGTPTGEIEPLTDEEWIEECKECDIVVRDNATLTHVTTGLDQFRDLTIYPTGKLSNIESNLAVNRLLIQAENDQVGYAIIEKGEGSITANAIAHTKRIDAQYWYAFSLPYDCNINEITQANGESMGEYGVHWGIQYYDGKRRQQEGTSANLGQSSKFWLPMGPNDKLNAYQGYLIALFDASVQKPTDMRTIYFPPAEENTYTESGSDSKQTNVYSWNVNLTCEKRHHGWNFTGTPYISMFNPVAAGITDADLSNVLMTGTWDPVENEYEENEHVYVSIPTPNGGKYYNQHLASTKELLPFMAYFVQTSDPTTDDETKQLTYAKGGRELPAAAPARAAATAQRVLVELLVTAPDGQTDNTGVWVDENYVPEYELAADLTKMYVAGEKPQLYTLAANNEKMAYNALPDGAATNIPLGLYAPIAGDYNLSLNERMSRIAGAEGVELIYNNAVVANLLFQDYTITANKGNVNGYSLCIRRRANVTTAVDNVTGSVITMIVNDGYISVLGVPTDATVYVYDMVGHLMEMQSANGNTVVNMPSVPQGVYNIVITNDKGSTTIKSFVK